MADFELAGCPACQHTVVNGKQKYTCRKDFKNCTIYKTCPFKTKVYDVLEYLSTASNTDGIQEVVKDIVKYLKEKR